jgi:hypothetical protein
LAGFTGRLDNNAEFFARDGLECNEGTRDVLLDGGLVLTIIMAWH